MIKTTQDFLKLDDVQIEKMKCHWSKEAIKLTDKDIEKILVCDEFAYGKCK